jgi:hypothetical protein
VHVDIANAVAIGQAEFLVADIGKNAFDTSAIGFGLTSVSSAKRVPSPLASMTAFIVRFQT